MHITDNISNIDYLPEFFKIDESSRSTIMAGRLRKGQEISSHLSDQKVTFMVIRGKVKMNIEGEHLVLSTHDIIHLKPKERHSLIGGEEDNLFVIYKENEPAQSV